MSAEKPIVHHKLGRILKTTGKILFRTLLSILVLLLVIILLIQFPAIQNYIKNKVVASLNEKLQTTIELGHIRINFAGSLVVEDFFVADRQQDTVIFARQLKVAVNPAGLLKKKVIVRNISLSGANFTYLVLDKHGHTNLDFIINAFAGDTKEEKPQKESSWDIQVKKVQLNNNRFVYHNMPDSMKFALNLGLFRIHVAHNNLDLLLFDVEEVVLKNTRASMVAYQKVSKPEQIEQAKDSPADTNSLSLSIGKINLEKVAFEQRDSLSGAVGKYFLGNALIVPETINLSKQILEIANIQLKNSAINFTAPETNANTTTLEQDDTEVAGTGEPWKITLEKGKLAFDKVTLKNVIPADSGLEYLANISLSHVVTDISARFNDGENWNVHLNSLRFEDDRTSELIALAATASAQEGQINVTNLDFRLGRSYVNGNFRGDFGNAAAGAIPDFDGRIKSSRLRVSDFVPYLPKSIYSNLNRIPSQININASFKGENQLLEGSGEVKTTEGNITFTANLEQGKQASYDFKIGIDRLNAGYFAQNPELGQLSASLEAHGSGFDPDSMNTGLNLQIKEVSFKGIDYSNIGIIGKIVGGTIMADVKSANPLVNLRAKINGNLGENPQFRLNTHIENVDLNAMKLIEDTIAVSGIIDATYESRGEGRFVASTDTMLVDIIMPKNEVSTNSELYYAILGDSVNARVNSNFGSIAFEGNVPLQDVPAVMKNYFSQYFSEQKADSAQNSEKYFAVDIDIKDLGLLKEFMALEIDVPADAEITASLKNNQLVSDVNIEKIILKDIEIDNLTLHASGRDSSFEVDFKTAAVHNNVHTIRDLAFTSDLGQGILDSRISFSNAASQKWFDIGATLQPQNPELNLEIKEPLMLSHENWEVDDQNRTYIQNKNIVFSNVRLTLGNKVISLLSDAQRPEKLTASFKNLTLALVSEVLYGDTSYLSGNIDGELMATSLFAKPVPVFDANLGISGITLVKKSLGDLNVSASNTVNNDIAQLDVNFGHDKMRFSVNGSYGLAKGVPMDLTLSTRNLELAALQPLIPETLSDASGVINTSLNIKGSFAEPDVTGQIAFDKIKAFIEPVQAGFQLDNQKILFRGDKIQFNNFTLKDSDGDPMEINGQIALAELQTLNYNLDIRTEDFLAYQGPEDNLPGQENRVIVTSDIKFSGKNNTPHINADITIGEGSRFFYKILKGPSTLTEEGVVEFDGKKDTTEGNGQEPSIAENLSVNANISVAKFTAVKIITDPVRNLGLNMEAGGTFTLNQRPYQSPSLTGRLEISGGDYTISLSGIKRTFQIADSSFIVWYGNISKPELNLRAYYEVRTSPAELIGSNQAGTLPFMVNMIISGNLDAPEFTFRLSLPKEYERAADGAVAAKLQEINSNESELNQKAMTLLLFGSFGFDNFANVLGSRNGTNIIISNALNQFAAQKLKFVDLHFELESYDNYGGETQDNLRTELEVAASKKLADERLNLALGATVILQADEQEQRELSVADRISPEFNIEYRINKPRTLSVHTFRRSEYRGLVEGKVISTGAGILFQKDFNKLSELFRKPKPVEVVADHEPQTNNE